MKKYLGIILAVLITFLPAITQAGPVDFGGGSGGGGTGTINAVGDCVSGDALTGSCGTYIRLFDGGTHYGQLAVPTLSANAVYTMPSADAIICGTNAVCAGYQASLTNPVTGTGTQYYWPYWSSSSVQGSYHMAATKVACSDSNGAPVACTNLTDASYLTSLSGAVLTDQTVGQTIGVTGARLTKLWATDITVTNSIAGSVTGSAASAGKSTNLVGGNSTTLLGSIPYQSDTDTTTLLPPNITTTKKFLRQTGDGVNGAIPAWDTAYYPGGTDVALADGGTGASLSDPDADTILGWDDTDNAVKFITLGTGLTYTHATHTLSATGDVLAPATNTANYVPQWNGANSKTLKDGLAVDSANTASAIMQRDANGDVVVGSIQLVGGAEPTCNIGNRGKIWYIAGGTEVKDIVEICVKNASNVYGWAPIY